jgi:hypothetical protein
MPSGIKRRTDAVNDPESASWVSERIYYNKSGIQKAVLPERTL